MESTVPLRARTDAGALAPLDHSITATADGWKPVNPLVAVEMPHRADQALALPSMDVTVKAVGTDPTPGTLISDTVVYANAAGTDADLLAKAVPGGAEVAWTLRSAASPESYALEFELPEGATITEATPVEKGAVIERSGEQLAHIPPPVATDADGLPVPLVWEVDGARLTIEIPHRAEAHAYPLLLDPLIVGSGQMHDDTSFDHGFADWLAYRSDPEFSTASGNVGIGWGLAVGANAGSYHGYLAQATWSQNAPGTRSYIFYATFTNVVALGAYQASGVPYSWIMEGVDNSAGWEAGYSTAAVGYSPYVTGGTLSAGRTTGHCFAYCGTPVYEDNTIKLMTFTNPGGYAPAAFWTYLGGAATWIGDAEEPVVRDVEHRVNGVLAAGRPSGWFNGQTLGVTTEARDLGLGVKSFKLVVPNSGDQIAERSCTGGAGSRCTSTGYVRSHPAGQGFSYSTAAHADPNQQMPQGANLVTARATDVVGNVASQYVSWPVRIDRTQPGLTATGFGGNEAPLSSQANPLVGNDATVEVKATDPLSGATSVNLLIDGQEKDRISAPCPVSGGCNLEGLLQPEMATVAPGQHTYAVVATDAAGNTRQITGSFRVDATPPSLSVTGPLVDSQEGPVTTPTANATIQASDTGPGDTGIARVQVKVDSQGDLNHLPTCSPACPGSVTRSYTYSKATWGPGAHQVLFRVRDAAGNVAERQMRIDVPARPMAAACPSTPPTSLPPADVVTVAAAQAAALPNSVAASQAAEDAVYERTVSPSLAPDPDAPLDPMATIDALTSEDVGARPASGVAMGDILCMVPAQTTSQETNAGLPNGDAALNANSAPGTDTITRPTASGVAVITSRRTTNSPAALSWRVGVQNGYTLQQLSNGAIVAFDPNRPGSGEAVPARPANAESPAALNDAAVQLAESRYQIARAEELTGRFVAAVIARPYGLSAAGTPSPAATTLSGQQVTVNAPAGSRAVVVPAVRNPRATYGPKPARALYMNVQNVEDLRDQAAALGCHVADEQEDPETVLVMDFGGPWKVEGEYGVKQRGKTFFNNGQILSALKEAARSYSSTLCHDPGEFAFITFGTSSNVHGEVDVVTELGRRVTKTTRTFSRWLDPNPLADPLYPVGAYVGSDVEGAYGGFGRTQRYINGLNAYEGGFINYGNAPCPQEGNGATMCTNEWTILEHATLAFAANALPMPEIYAPGAEKIWQNIRQVWNSPSVNRGFYGVTGSRQKQLCVDPPKTIEDIKWVPTESWERLDRATNHHAGEYLINIRDAVEGGDAWFCED